MISRISDNTRFDTVTGNLSALQTGVGRVVEQLTTQKKINRPADDPEGMTTVLALRSTGASIDQYRTNVLQGQTWLKMSETALEGVTTLLSQADAVVRNLEGATASERSAAADSVGSLCDQMKAFANSQLGGQYLFSGSSTETQPFGGATPGYLGNDQTLSVNVGQDFSVGYNLTGDTLFTFPDGAGGTDDIFESLENLETVLRDAGSSDADVDAARERLQGASDQVRTNVEEGVVKIDTVLTNLEFVDNHLTDLKNRVTTVISGREDADIATLAVSFQMELMALNASYSAATKIGENSLLNFLG